MRSITLAIIAANLALAQTPVIQGLLNVADNSSQFSPGLETLIYGSNFGNGGGPSLSVTVGGKQAYVISAKSTQIDVQLPVDAALGATTLSVTSQGITSAPYPIVIDAFAPAIFFGGFQTSNSKPVSQSSPARAGDSLAVNVIGLGATTPPTPTGTAPMTSNPTVTLPTITVGRANNDVSYAGSLPGQIGEYQVKFRVPANAQGSSPVALSIGGKSSSPKQLELFGISTVLNNASFRSGVSPGSIASVFANGLGTVNQTSGFPGTSFQGVSVTFNGIPAPLFHLVATLGQIDLLVPYELPESGIVNLKLTAPSGVNASYPLTIAMASPGIYYQADPSKNGRFNILAQFNNTAWLAMPSTMATALKIPGDCIKSSVNPVAVCGQPAAPGDYLVLYTTGLGRATPNGDPNGVPLKTGSVPPADGSVLYKTVVTPTVTVGGLPATVVFSGIAPGFPGEYQIDFQVPAGVIGDDVPVVVSRGDASVNELFPYSSDREMSSQEMTRTLATVQASSDPAYVPASSHILRRRGCYRGFQRNPGNTTTPSPIQPASRG